MFFIVRNYFVCNVQALLRVLVLANKSKFILSCIFLFASVAWILIIFV